MEAARLSTSDCFLAFRRAFRGGLIVKTRTPSEPATPAWTPKRQEGGARTECTERVVLRAEGFETSGWTLNVSRGGLRAVVEDRLDLDVHYEILVGEAATPRHVRLVWSQNQSDGQSLA